MFYDDVVCNASPKGLKYMLERYGYHEMIFDHKLSTSNETTIVCTLCTSNSSQPNPLLNPLIFFEKGPFNALQ